MDSKLKKQDHVYVLKSQGDDQESKVSFRHSQRTGPYIGEKALLHNINLVPKIETDITRVLHLMSLRPFTPRQLIHDRKITPLEFKPDTKVIIRPDDL